jgi:exodeoxyribonuclease VII large subunit
VTGLGHEDDLTVADLVADHRAATPTAAIVSLLPDRQEALRGLQQRRQSLHHQLQNRISREQQRLADKRHQLAEQAPELAFQHLKQELSHRQRLLQALSPQRWLKRGLAIVSDAEGAPISSVQDAAAGDQLTIQLQDGALDTRVNAVRPTSVSPNP